MDVIASVAPRTIPVRQSACTGRRLNDGRKQTDNQFFFALTHHRHLRSVLPSTNTLLSSPFLTVSHSAKKHIKIQKTHSQKRLSRLIPVYAPLFLFLHAIRVNRMHLVAEKSYKAVTTPSFKSHRKYVCLACPSSGSSSGSGCPFCSGPGCVILQPPSADCGVRSLCFPVCW